MKPNHEHAKIIEFLGDAAELARLLSAKEVADGRKPISRQTVQGWKKRGFPAKIQLRYQTMIRKAEKSLKEM